MTSLLIINYYFLIIFWTKIEPLYFNIIYNVPFEEKEQENNILGTIPNNNTIQIYTYKYSLIIK